MGSSIETTFYRFSNKLLYTFSSMTQSPFGQWTMLLKIMQKLPLNGNILKIIFNFFFRNNFNAVVLNFFRYKVRHMLNCVVIYIFFLDGHPHCGQYFLKLVISVMSLVWYILNTALTTRLFCINFPLNCIRSHYLRSFIFLTSSDLIMRKLLIGVDRAVLDNVMILLCGNRTMIFIKGILMRRIYMLSKLWIINVLFFCVGRYWRLRRKCQQVRILGR